MSPSTLKKIPVKRWILLVCGWVAWFIVLYYMPSDLHYPWNVLNLLLAILSPYLWSRALTINMRYQSMSEDEAKVVPRAMERTV